MAENSNPFIPAHGLCGSEIHRAQREGFSLLHSGGASAGTGKAGNDSNDRAGIIWRLLPSHTQHLDGDDSELGLRCDCKPKHPHVVCLGGPGLSQHSGWVRRGHPKRDSPEGQHFKGLSQKLTSHSCCILALWAKFGFRGRAASQGSGRVMLQESKGMAGFGKSDSLTPSSSVAVSSLVEHLWEEVGKELYSTLRPFSSSWPPP